MKESQIDIIIHIQKKKKNNYVSLSIIVSI